MPTFVLSLNWTDQGIRSVKDAPKRAEASKELARNLGLEIKEVYLTSGDDDILIILDAPNGDNVAKFALALGSQGNVRTLVLPPFDRNTRLGGLSPNELPGGDHSEPRVRVALVVIVEPPGDLPEHRSSIRQWMYASIVALECFDEGFSDAV